MLFRSDLFTAEGCKTAVQTAVDAFGGLDILVNNASTAISGNIETLDDEGLMERLNGKTLAYMRCCRAALPHLRKAKSGRVICIGGSAARHAGATALPSALGNSALIAFVKRFSTTVASQGITANIALRLGRFFDVDPQWFMAMQSRYDIARESEAIADVLAEIKPRAA